MRALQRILNFRRLAAGLLTLALIGVAVHLVAPELRPDKSRETNPSISPARLLKTPGIEGEDLKVGPAVGKLAPDFEVSRPDGKRVHLSELRGRPVVINFWARWCTSCLTEMPALAKVQQARGLQTFDVFAINAGETSAQATEFIDFLKAPFVYGLDGDLTVADAYGVYGLPMSVFVDSRGIVRAVYSGLLDQNRMNAFLDAAIKASPAPDLPAVIRPVTTIPREHVISVKAEATDRLLFTSRALRCDANYCAGPAIELLKSQIAGILNTELDTGKPDATLSVKFDPRIITSEQVTAAIFGNLRVSNDPLYDTPLTLKSQTN